MNMHIEPRPASLPPGYVAPRCARISNRSYLQSWTGKWMLVALALLAHHASAFSPSSLYQHYRRLRRQPTECIWLMPLPNPFDGAESIYGSSDQLNMQQYRPIPVMPSPLFQQLALSQLELLASSLPSPGKPGISKIKSMSLYLPQENVNTGQLEFLPAVLYPHPGSERVFIASEADSGVAPTLPRTLTKLPGFAHATSLLPGYPMVSSGVDKMAGIGAVEEVLCDLKASNGGAALSVPLFAGSQTVGVLLVSPSVARPRNGESVWTKGDREQVARAAQSLSLALSMDSERAALQLQSETVRDALSDSLHQVKNPLQALRTYGKLLQRRIADFDDNDAVRLTPQLLELAEHLMVQSDRLVDRLKPVDSIVDSLESRPPSLTPSSSNSNDQSLVRWRAPFLPWEREVLEFARDTPSSSSPNTKAQGGGAEQRYRDSKIDKDSPGSKKSRPNNEGRPAPLSMMENMELEMAFVADVLEPILSAFQAIAVDRGISFVVETSDELPGVTISPQALQEAVSNVLDNSFKYVILPKSGLNSSRNPSPKVRMRLSPNSSDLEPGVTILVEDNGPGIKQEDRSAIFERGFRAEATRSVSGTGIGLDIALALMQRMGGRLEVSGEGRYHGASMKFVIFRNPKLSF